VFGGSLMLMGIDDGGELDTPINENSIRKIEFLRVYDRYRVTWSTSDLYSDPANPKYGTPQYYTISPFGGESFVVHETRVIRFDGPITDDHTFQENNYWNESVYRKIYTQLINVNSAFASTKDIMDDFIQVIIQIDNLQNLVASGQDDLVKKRLNIIDLGRHVMNTIMLDSKEKYTKESSSVAGVHDLLQEFEQALSAVSDIPMTILMGRSPGGMNATGDADIRLYYDTIADAQDEEMYDQMTRLITLIMLSKEGPTKGKKEDTWFIEFNPLWQPTEKETVETRKTQAETDQIYIANGVIEPGEITQSRFGGDEYSIETSLSEGLRDNDGLLKEPSIEEEQESE
ncbi:MAG: DUF1073 domain-containing protein, partial [Scytonema sp. CRU_2_7]|nr:DUF1073 domain-containing protein [Scytonema sp. CRU_2_7]